MEVNEGYFDRTTKKEAKEELLRLSRKKLVELEKPLMVLWNVEQYEIRRMVAWTAFIDKEMEVLNSMLEEPTTIERFQIHRKLTVFLCVSLNEGVQTFGLNVT